MNIFLAGATGVIGRRLVPLLSRSGHGVVGLTRHEEKADTLRAMGAEPVICNALDSKRLSEAVIRSHPEVVVHELTDIPRAIDFRKYGEQFGGNDHLRVEGTKNLVKAALLAGARRIVAQGVAFAYAPTGGPMKSEGDPLFDDAPEPFRRSVSALRSLERSVTETPGLEGIVLRYGMFYGPGSAYAIEGHWASEARRRRLPIVGRGEGITSFVHVDDAAAATVAAVHGGRPGIYNVVDDDPAPMREWIPLFSDAIGAPPPRRLPAFLVRLIAGSAASTLATRSRGASNAKAKSELGWRPRHPSWRTGFREALG